MTQTPYAALLLAAALPGVALAQSDLIVSSIDADTVIQDNQRLGDGLRAVTPGLPSATFLPTVGNSGANGSFQTGPGVLSLAGGLHGSALPMALGSTWYVQGVYRDSLAPASPCGTGLNLTNAVGMTLMPRHAPAACGLVVRRSGAGRTGRSAIAG